MLMALPTMAEDVVAPPVAPPVLDVGVLVLEVVLDVVTLVELGGTPGLVADNVGREEDVLPASGLGMFGVNWGAAPGGFEMRGGPAHTPPCGNATAVAASAEIRRVEERIVGSDEEIESSSCGLILSFLTETRAI